MDKRILSAGLWSAADAFFRFGVGFAVSVILARILSPADFGIYAMTGIFIGLSGVLVDGGLSSALIQKQNTDQRTETAVFQYNILVAGVLASGIAAIAPLVARTYGYPVLRPLLYASAAILFVNSFGAVPGAMMQRRLELAKFARLGVVASLLSAVAAVAAALLGAGIWTFPIQAGVSAGLHVVGIWFLTDWRPRGRFDLRPAKGLANYGSLLALSGLLEVAYSSGYPLILGRLYGASEIGYYNRGQNLQALPSNVLSGIVQRVLFPTLSAKLHDPAAIKRSTKAAVGAAMVANVPAMLFLAFFSELVVRVLFGDKWLPSAPVLTVLAIGGVLFPLHVVNLQVILAQGRSGLFFRLEVVKKLLGIALVVAGCFYGVMGLAVSQLVFVVLAFFINADPSRKLIGYSSLEQLKDIVGICALSLSLMVALKALEPFVAIGDALKLAILLALAGSTYLVAATLLRVGPIHDVMGLVRAQLTRGRRTPTRPVR